MQMGFVGYYSNHIKVYSLYGDDARDYGRAFDARWRKTSFLSAPTVLHLVHTYNRVPEQSFKEMRSRFLIEHTYADPWCQFQLYDQSMSLLTCSVDQTAVFVHHAVAIWQ